MTGQVLLICAFVLAVLAAATSRESRVLSLAVIFIVVYLLGGLR